MCLCTISSQLIVVCVCVWGGSETVGKGRHPRGGWGSPCGAGEVCVVVYPRASLWRKMRLRFERRATRGCRGAHRAHRLVRRRRRKRWEGREYHHSSAVAGSTFAQMRHHMSSLTAVGPVLSAMRRESASLATSAPALVCLRRCICPRTSLHHSFTASHPARCNYKQGGCSLCAVAPMSAV